MKLPYINTKLPYIVDVQTVFPLKKQISKTQIDLLGVKCTMGKFSISTGKNDKTLKKSKACFLCT